MKNLKSRNKSEAILSFLNTKTLAAVPASTAPPTLSTIPTNQTPPTLAAFFTTYTPNPASPLTTFDPNPSPPYAFPQILTVTEI